MERREFVTGLGVVAAAAAASSTFAQDHSQHSHGAAPNQALINDASQCVSAGEVCLTHCQEMLAQGDKSLADCAKSVRELVTVCGGLRSLAAQNAAILPKYAGLAADVCKGCEAQCRKHESQHAVCKACADACAACYTECKKVA
jgi:Cys-rich four helix bundle protein (predicted Tat secretion target)